MTEEWCATLLVLLVPLVTALNGLLLSQVRHLRGEVAMRRSTDRPDRDVPLDG